MKGLLSLAFAVLFGCNYPFYNFYMRPNLLISILCTTALLFVYLSFFSNNHLHPKRQLKTGFFYLNHNPPSMIISSQGSEYSLPILSTDWPRRYSRVIVEPNKSYRWPVVPIAPASHKIVINSLLYPGLVEISGYADDPSAEVNQGKILFECEILISNLDSNN